MILIFLKSSGQLFCRLPLWVCLSAVHYWGRSRGGDGGAEGPTEMMKGEKVPRRWWRGRRSHGDDEGGEGPAEVMKEKEMATHSSVLAWRIPGTGEAGGLPSMGSHRVGHDWRDLAVAAAAEVMVCPSCIISEGSDVELSYCLWC